MSCDTIAVAVRVRPSSSKERTSEKIVHVLDDHVLAFDPSTQQQSGAYIPNNKRKKDLKFAFDYVFGEQSAQHEVYNQTVRPRIDALFEGYNISVFAYGATGAGKTHTMLGTQNDPGIMAHSMEDIFDRIENLKTEKNITVSLSMLEVYNETIKDLLCEENSSVCLDVREDSSGVVVPGLSEHSPKNAQEVLQLLARGNGNRTQSPTAMNATSSRSHAVLQVKISQQARTKNIKSTLNISKLSLIDLAGSERATQNTGERLIEGANINRSLLSLANCINALAEEAKNANPEKERKSHIPYRDSKLTRLLKDSLGGNTRTLMIANVAPTNFSYEDTYNTLKYADRAKTIRVKVEKNEVNVEHHVSQYTSIIKSLREEVEELKGRLQEKESNPGEQSKEEVSNLKIDHSLFTTHINNHQKLTVTLSKTSLQTHYAEQMLSLISNVTEMFEKNNQKVDQLRTIFETLEKDLNQLKQEVSVTQQELESITALIMEDQSKVTGSQIQKQLLLSDLQQQMSNNEKNALQSAIKDSMKFSSSLMSSVYQAIESDKLTINQGFCSLIFAPFINVLPQTKNENETENEPSNKTPQLKKYLNEARERTSPYGLRPRRVLGDLSNSIITPKQEFQSKCGDVSTGKSRRRSFIPVLKNKNGFGMEKENVKRSENLLSEEQSIRRYSMLS